MPLRMKEVHIVRQPFLFNMVWPMFKQFVGDKLKKRVRINYCMHIKIYDILRNELQYTAQQSDDFLCMCSPC